MRGRNPKRNPHRGVFRSQGFTLVELLIAIVILGFVMGSAIALLFTFLVHFEQTDDLTAAKQRGEMVLAILKDPVLMSGMGMSSVPASSFSSAFSGLNPVSSWGGPVSAVSNDSSGSPSVSGTPSVLRLVYAVPSGAGTNNTEYNVSTSSSNIQTTPSFDAAQLSTTSGNTKNWILFPSAGIPLSLSAWDASGNLTVKTLWGSATIARFDEMHYLRATRAYVSGNSFYTQDVTLASAQPRVDGVVGFYASFDATSGTLNIVVLSRGTKDYGRTVTATAPVGWNASWGGLTAENQRYRLAVTRAAWRVRNDGS